MRIGDPSGVSGKRPRAAPALRGLWLAGSALFAWGLSGSALAATYNPKHLSATSLSRVAEVCTTVLGLNPHERLTGGTWRGSAPLDYFTSHYRGCILSLSGSLLALAEQQRLAVANEACRAAGHAPNTASHAACVLQKTSEETVAETSADADVTVSAASSGGLARVSRPVVGYTPREMRRREEQACAALGLEPSEPGFSSCVKDLADTFFAIDNPIGE